ncbi:MAG: FAD:protein FMN transferase [Lachnospiraceae bacterium]|nr:FAD:protein FMN transferase [Lachnospiraceae bacterium]
MTGTGSENTEGSEYTKTIFAMDTYMTLTAYGEQAQEAVDAGVAEIERLDEIFSTGDENSEIYAINAAGGGELSEETAMLIQRSLEIYEKTGGIFDISIYPVMKLWGFTSGDYKVPDAAELEQTLALVNAGDLTLTEQDGETVLSMEEGMEIDLGGIVKGYADDRVAEIFAEYGIEDAIINLGGDVHVMGNRPDGTGWRVGIQDPEDSDGFLGGLTLTDCSVVTSGGYERYFEDEETGVRYHHIIDPRTGASANNGLISVSVVSTDGTLADALSTTLFILGSDDAVEYCESFSDSDGFDALLMTEDREIYITEDLAEYFIDLNGDTQLNIIETHK